MTAEDSAPASRLGVLMADVTSGLVLYILNASTALSMAALVFAGMPPEFFVLGVTMLLLSLVVTVLGGAIGSGFPITVVGPRSGYAPVYGTMVAAIAASLPIDSPALRPTIVATFLLGTALTGVFFVIAGRWRIGNVIRYIPYPVMAGFFAGIGLIFLTGGLSVAGGVPISLDTMDDLLSARVLSLVAPAVVFGVALFVVTRRISHWSVFPLFIVGSIALFFAVTALLGFSMADRIAAGWLPAPSGARIALPLITPADFGHIEWSLVIRQAGAFASLALIATLILLIDTSGIELVADRELDYDRELTASGVTNLVNGLLGGYVGVQTAADTALAYKLGARTRRMGGVLAALIAATMIFGTALVETVPTFLLGGMLFYLGLDFMITWGWSKRREMPLHDYAIVIVILATIAFAGIIPGIATGLVIAILLFVVSFSRVEVVTAEFGGDAYGSMVVRDPEETEILAERNRGIRIFRLQGYLFFGTADRLFRLVKSRLKDAQEGPFRYVIFEARHITGMDTTTFQTLRKLDKFARREGVLVIIAGAQPETRERLLAAGFGDLASRDHGATGVAVAASLEAAFIWCEEDILRDIPLEARRVGTGLTDLLELMTGSADAATLLSPCFTQTDVAAGDDLFRQGDDGDGLYVLVSGAASVVVQVDAGKERVLRKYERGTMLGEMALFTGEKRTATVRADRQSVFFRLGTEAFERAQQQHPVAAALLQSYVIRLMADRLSRANREVQALS